MVQYNKNIKNKKKGFTLVELMVVLAITAILAALGKELRKLYTARMALDTGKDRSG
mgnify:CR=1 FL=1